MSAMFVQHRLTIRYCRFAIILGVGKVNLEFVTVSQIMFIFIVGEKSLQLWMFYALQAEGETLLLPPLFQRFQASFQKCILIRDVTFSKNNFQASGLDSLNGSLLFFGDRAMESYTHVLSPASEEQSVRFYKVLYTYSSILQLCQLGIWVSFCRAGILAVCSLFF